MTLKNIIYYSVLAILGWCLLLSDADGLAFIWVALPFFIIHSVWSWKIDRHLGDSPKVCISLIAARAFSNIFILPLSFAVLLLSPIFLLWGSVRYLFFIKPKGLGFKYISLRILKEEFKTIKYVFPNSLKTQKFLKHMALMFSGVHWEPSGYSPHTSMFDNDMWETNLFQEDLFPSKLQDWEDPAYRNQPGNIYHH